jgi:hypothetical protein
MSLAKISTVIYAFLGLIVGFFVAIAIAFGALAGSFISNSPNVLLGFVLAFGAIILFPVMYAILGFLAGLITSALYNWVVGYTGGIQLDLE